ncbi:MAG: class I SAM-dependent methyltransferase, partial [Minisyncoccia bacterium]
YKNVSGVEPGREAIEKARGDIKKHIKMEMFTKDSLPPNSFDCICIFQTLDHLLDPVKMLEDALAILKPGGVLIAINHNLNSLSSKILGEKSPIIDIEHTYLYNKNTIRKLFEKSGFEVIKIFFPYSRHSVGYLFSLLPIQPVGLKKMIHRILDFLRVSDVPLFVPIGNLGIVAKKKVNF